MEVIAILERALDMVKNDENVSGLDSIQAAGSTSTVDERRAALEYFQRAALRPPTGMRKKFQQGIMECALHLAKRNVK